MKFAKEEIENIKQRILNDEKLVALLPEDYEDIYPMSDISKGMVYASLMNPGMGIYHDQFIYELKDITFHPAIFERALYLLAIKA